MCSIVRVNQKHYDLVLAALYIIEASEQSVVQWLASSVSWECSVYTS